MIKKLLYCCFVLYSINAMENKNQTYNPLSLRQQSYYAVIAHLKNNLSMTEEITDNFDYLNAMKQAYQDFPLELKNCLSINNINRPENELYLKEISPNNTFMLLLNTKNIIKIYDLAKKFIIKKMELNQNYKAPMACFPDGRLLWYDNKTEKLNIYSTTTGLKKYIPQTVEPYSLHCIDNCLIATHCSGFHLDFLNIIDIRQPKKVIRTLKVGARLKTMSFHQNLLFCTYFHNNAYTPIQTIAWNYQEGQTSYWSAPFECYHHKLQQSSLVAWKNKDIFIADLLQTPPSIIHLQNPISINETSLSDNYLAIGTDKNDHSIYLWDLKKKQCCIKIPSERSPITKLSWSHGQSSLIAQNGKGNFLAIDLTFLKVLKNLFEEKSNNNNNSTQN